jgi:hypothetical protein
LTLGSYWANRPFQELIVSLNSFKEHNDGSTKSFEQASAEENKIKTRFVKVERKNPVIELLTSTNEIRSKRYSDPDPMK